MDLDIEKMSNKEICSTLGITMGQLRHAYSRKKLSMVEAVEYCINRRNLSLWKNRCPLEYAVFHSMKRRTTNPNDKDYKRLYGKKEVCSEWLGEFGFVSFIRSVGPMPSHEKVAGRNLWTLDRIDGNKGYSPENCRWATIKQQNRNKSNNIYLINGQLGVDVAAENGIKKSTFYERVRHYGWSPEKAATFPLKGRRTYGV